LAVRKECDELALVSFGIEDEAETSVTKNDLADAA
jgi:hypothetical protein